MECDASSHRFHCLNVTVFCAPRQESTNECVENRWPTKSAADAGRISRLGARLDHELSVVRPFTRKHGFVFKARTWDEFAKWESQRRIKEQRQRDK
jgi:hypothetical protein